MWWSLLVKPGSNTALLEAKRGSASATDVGIEVDQAGHALDFASGSNEVSLKADQNGDAKSIWSPNISKLAQRCLRLARSLRI